MSVYYDSTRYTPGNDSVSASTSGPITVNQTGNYNYIGCFSEATNGRALSGNTPAIPGGSNTIESCEVSFPESNHRHLYGYRSHETCFGTPTAERDLCIWKGLLLTGAFCQIGCLSRFHLLWNRILERVYVLDLKTKSKSEANPQSGYCGNVINTGSVVQLSADPNTNGCSMLCGGNTTEYVSVLFDRNLPFPAPNTIHGTCYTPAQKHNLPSIVVQSVFADSRKYSVAGPTGLTCTNSMGL